MKTSEQGLSLIRRCEGFSACQYICPAGRPTIGYGHVIRAGEAYTQDEISPDDAERLLIQDVNQAEQAVGRCVTVTLCQNQFDALVAFTYNIGIGAFEKSTLLKLMNEGDMDGAADQFGHWVYGGGHILEGLVTRRAQEAALFNG